MDKIPCSKHGFRDFSQRTGRKHQEIIILLCWEKSAYMNPCHRHTKFPVTIILMLLAIMSCAQTPKNLHFLQLPFEGLSHPTVNCIFQDKTGFLWLGTINGLNRYDGYNYKVFQSDGDINSGLSNNYINSIGQDGDENLWVGTKYGLNLLMKNGNYFKTYLPDENNPNALINPNIEVVYRDSKDRMWVGSWGGLSLYRKSTGDFINFSHDPLDESSISGNVVTTIMEDSRGRLWIGTAFSGLNLMDLSTNRFTRFQKEAKKSNCISGNSISAIYEDEQGQIWVGAQRGGLNRFNEASQTFKWYLNEEKRTSIASNTVYSIIEDENGELMVGGMNGGISVYNSEEDNFHRFDTYGNYNPFGSKASVFSHYKLRSGEIVIATSNGGVKIQDNYPTAITWHQHVEGNDHTLRMNNVLALAEDAYGNFWVGTSGGGLNYLTVKTGKFKWFPHFKDKTVNSLCFDKPGHLWIGTLEHGLAKYDIIKNAFTYFPHHPDEPESLNTNHVTRLIKDDNGLWTGTDRGISLFNPEKQRFQHFHHSTDKNEKLEIGKVNSLLIDHARTVWMASESGLHYYDKKDGIFRLYRFQGFAKGKNRDWVSYLYEDSHECIWMSTLDGNLILLDANRKPIKPGVSNPNYQITEVTNMMEDFNGFFWITCRQGLFKCEVDQGTYGIRVLNKLNKSDGLQGNLFNSHAGLVSKRSGNILVGGLNGLNRLNPLEMDLNPNVPPVILTGMMVNGEKYRAPDKKELFEVDEVSLSTREASSIDIYFTALNFIKSQKNQYAFMLEGYDETWHYAGNKHVASYSNLAPGKYHLKVKAANNHGVWNHDNASLGIIITAQIWETAGFKLGLMLMTIVIIVAGFTGYRRYRARQPDHLSLSDLVFRNHQTADSKVVLSGKHYDKAFVERAVKYVESNIDNDELSIESMCAELGLSRARLFRKIKELTGQTVSGFIKDIRLEKAKLYLDANPRSVSEVAFAIGFKSHAHFTRSFKEKFGISPSAYVQGR